MRKTSSQVFVNSREDDFSWSLDSSRCPGDSLCRVCRVDLVLSYAHWAPVQLASVSHDGDVSDPEVVALSSKVIMLYSKFSSKQGVCSKWQQGVFAQQEVVLQGVFAQQGVVQQGVCGECLSSECLPVNVCRVKRLCESRPFSVSSQRDVADCAMACRFLDALSHPECDLVVQIMCSQHRARYRATC